MNSSRILIDIREINETHSTIDCCCTRVILEKEAEVRNGVEAQVQHCLENQTQIGEGAINAFNILGKKEKAHVETA